MSDYEYWDSAYTSGEFKHWESDHPSPELVALVAANIVREGSRVLDVGCGGGLEAIFLAKCGFRVVGVDFSGVALQIARRRARQARAKVEWRQGDALELPIDSASIDFINDRGVFHVIDEADRPRYASELSRVLKRGGAILIRGSRTSREEHFNPVTERAIDKHFPSSEFRRGPVLPIALLSVVGTMDGRMVVLTKIGSESEGMKPLGRKFGGTSD